MGFVIIECHHELLIYLTKKPKKKTALNVS